jgi:hypothetical protein
MTEAFSLILFFIMLSSTISHIAPSATAAITKATKAVSKKSL